MRKTLITTLALAMVFTCAVAGAQDRVAGVTTTWDGLANGADAVPLVASDVGGSVWTETATGYSIAQPGWYATSAITADDSTPPGDYRVELSIDHTDLAVEYGGTNVGFWLWAPSGPPGGSLGFGYGYDGVSCVCHYFEMEVDGVTTYGGPVVQGAQVTIRIERVGDIATWSVKEAGIPGFTVLQTADLAALGIETDFGDAGLFLWADTGLLTTRINYAEWSYPPASAATATITQSASTPDPFVGGTASWDVSFSEDVTGATAGAFSRTLGGTADADAAATVSGGPADYVVTFANVTIGVDGIGSIGLDFDGSGVTDVAGSTLPVADAANASQYIVGAAAAPTANTWVLVLMGIVLALAATAVIRKKALEQ